MSSFVSVILAWYLNCPARHHLSVHIDDCYIDITSPFAKIKLRKFLFYDFTEREKENNMIYHMKIAEE